MCLAQSWRHDMRLRIFLSAVILATATQTGKADIIIIDNFNTITQGGGDGSVTGGSDSTDRTFVADGSVMSVPGGAQDREMQASEAPVFPATPTNFATATVAGGVITGTVQGPSDPTSVSLVYDGGLGAGSDVFGVQDNLVSFDLLTQTAGNGQHSLFFGGSDGSGDNVLVAITVASGSQTATVSGLTFDESDGITQVLFETFTDINPSVDFSDLSSVQVSFTGSGTFTVDSIYAHNPEPASLAILGGLGILGLVMRRRS